jgi:hypothetical protein
MTSIFRILYAAAIVTVSVLTLTTVLLFITAHFGSRPVDPATGRSPGEWVALGVMINGAVIVYGLVCVAAGRSVRAHLNDPAASPISRIVAFGAWTLVGAAPLLAYAIVLLLFALPARC